MPITSRDERPEGNAVALFQTIRSDAGEELVLDKNFFIENTLPACVLRKLSDAEMAAYRRPYKNPVASQRPALTWPRELPIEGEPQDSPDECIFWKIELLNINSRESAHCFIKAFQHGITPKME